MSTTASGSALTIALVGSRPYPVTVTRDLTQDVKADIADALVPLGLRRRKLGFLTRGLSSECVGWIALGTASEGTPHARRVWPKVGVRHQEAERIVANLQGQVPHQYLPPTITTGLGYTSPANRWLEWAFAEGEDWSLQVAEILEAVTAYGLPWMRQRASLPSVLEAATSENLCLRDGIRRAGIAAPVAEAQ